MCLCHIREIIVSILEDSEVHVQLFWLLECDTRLQAEYLFRGQILASEKAQKNRRLLAALEV